MSWKSPLLVDHQVALGLLPVSTSIWWRGRCSKLWIQIPTLKMHVYAPPAIDFKITGMHARHDLFVYPCKSEPLVLQLRFGLRSDCKACSRSSANWLASPWPCMHACFRICAWGAFFLCLLNSRVFCMIARYAATVQNCCEPAALRACLLEPAHACASKGRVFLVKVDKENTK